MNPSRVIARSAQGAAAAVAEANEYRCLRGHVLRSQWRPFNDLRTHVTKADTIIYRAR
jgi:hypothetical protein